MATTVTEQLAPGAPVADPERAEAAEAELERLRDEHAVWRAEFARRVGFRRTAARAAALETLSEARAACTALEGALAATERGRAWHELRRLQAAAQDLTLHCARGGLADPGPPGESVSGLLDRH